MTETERQAVDVGGEEARFLTADDVARIVRGTVVGDGNIRVRRIAPLERAGDDALSFFSAAKYADVYSASGAGVVLVAPTLADVPTRARARIIVDKPHEALLALIPRFYAAPVRQPGIHETARIGRGVRLGRDVTVGPYVVLGDGVTLGDRSWVDAHCVVQAGAAVGADSRLFPHVTLYAGSRVGQRVVIHSGARIGSDGFGYVYRDGAHNKIPHVGGCIIEDDVEIGANTTIDRGSIDDTVIGAGTKIDNLVQIAHNVRVGRLCLIMAQVGIAGSAHLEDGCIVAGQAGVQGHMTIGKGARVGGQSGVFGDIPAGETWSGYPARPHRESLRASAALFKLAGMIKPLERLLAGRT